MSPRDWSFWKAAVSSEHFPIPSSLLGKRRLSTAKEEDVIALDASRARFQEATLALDCTKGLSSAKISNVVDVNTAYVPGRHKDPLGRKKPHARKIWTSKQREFASKADRPSSLEEFSAIVELIFHQFHLL